ncbi:hypothetical protein ACIP79_16895 [Streptomyces sp. NPDC088747]|uniref:hypothetical protein n=1 Tax=Streptomyces sp. NPDC088747 TaxID=3365886 RepID=UPI00381E1FD9
MNLKQAVAGVDARLGALGSALGRAGTAMSRAGGGADSASRSLGRLNTATGGSVGALGKIRTGLLSTDTALSRSRTGSDKLKSSLDKLRSAAKGAHGELLGVKKQADAVEKSVGRAGKNADAGGKSMGSLGKGLKGASLAQKGLNLAMAASPFGLIMTLLAPLIAQFVNMDKVTAVLRKVVLGAFKSMGSATSSAVRMIVPLLKGLGNGMLAPWIGLTSALNALFGVLAGIRIKVPDWVPMFGGRSFSFPSLHVPVPRLAAGGVVQARSGGTLALLGEAGEHEAVIPLSKLDRMIGSGGGLRTLTAAVEKLADRPVVVQVDSQEIARAVFLGQRQLARR